MTAAESLFVAMLAALVLWPAAQLVGALARRRVAIRFARLADSLEAERHWSTIDRRAIARVVASARRSRMRWLFPLFALVAAPRIAVEALAARSTDGAGDSTNHSLTARFARLAAASRADRIAETGASERLRADPRFQSLEALSAPLGLRRTPASFVAGAAIGVLLLSPLILAGRSAHASRDALRTLEERFALHAESSLANP